MKVKNVGVIFVTGTITRISLYMGQIGMKFKQKNVNRCPLLSIEP